MTDSPEDKPAKKAGFAEAVKQSLNELLGETAAKAVIYHVGDENLHDPKLFEKRVRTIFGAGAEIVLKYVTEKSETPSRD